MIPQAERADSSVHVELSALSVIASGSTLTISSISTDANVPLDRRSRKDTDGSVRYANTHIDIRGGIDTFCKADGGYTLPPHRKPRGPKCRVPPEQKSENRTLLITQHQTLKSSPK